MFTKHSGTRIRTMSGQCSEQKCARSLARPPARSLARSLARTHARSLARSLANTPKTRVLGDGSLYGYVSRGAA